MTFRKAASLLIVLAGLTGFAVGQAALTQTTLAAAVSGPSLYSGTSPTISQTVTLASCTGLAAPILPGTPSSIIYIDHEALGVFSINSTSCTAVVNRGYLSTQAAPHQSGAMVLYGPNYAVTIAQGGNPVPNGLFQQDPPVNGSCTQTSTPTTPWVNVLTGAQWLCSPTSNTWVPGFNNPLNPAYAGDMGTVASVAGAQTVLGPFFRISGTNAITSFTIPVGMNATAVGTASFCVYPTAAFTTVAGNNIASASTAVIGKTLCFTWNPSTLKFAASY
jgi:hypothetical protein